MKQLSRIGLQFLSLLLLTTNSAQASYLTRGSIWGLGGSESQGRVDALVPILSNQNNLFYSDIQGSIGNDNAWYAGLGAGYRMLANDSRIYGGYFFVDRNVSAQHNTYWILSPGVEAFFLDWDSRLNLYFPVGKRRYVTGLLPSQQGDCSYIVFKGHQQFEHHFSLFEEVGPGADAEAGYTFHRFYNTQLHGGVYYFALSDSSNIKGVEARIEIPVNTHWAVAFETSYDNYQHGTVVAGLRLNLGGTASQPPRSINDMQTNMVAPIPRNLGSLHTGSGMPVVKGKKDDGLFLERDNIYFFTSQGGAAFVSTAQSGTFENPLNNNQFTQPVVNQLGNNANLYFNSGTYVIQGAGVAPNAQISLLNGQSIYGRIANFKCAANGNARPLFLGRINLYEGNNTLNSFQLTNQLVHVDNGNQTIVAMDIESVTNIKISNANISAINTVTGNNASTNYAFAMNVGNSQVDITNSVINASANVTGTNNFLVGAFDFNIPQPNMNINISNSIINANASLGINNNAQVFVSNISSLSVPTGNNNTFNINNSTLNANVLVAGDNNAIALAGNVALSDNNHLVITNSTLNARAEVGNNNNIDVENISLNNNNTLQITSSTINSNALVRGNNSNSVLTTNITDESDNNISIANSTLNNNAMVMGNNNAGSFIKSYGIFESTSNNFTISSSTFNITSEVVSNNLGTNAATGFLTGAGSIININASTVNISAKILGSNLGTNTATGTTGAGVVNSSDTQFNVVANP